MSFVKEFICNPQAISIQIFCLSKNIKSNVNPHTLMLITNNADADFAPNYLSCTMKVI
jgi:hypothetical protein